MSKTLEELQKEFDEYKANSEKSLAEKDNTIKGLESKAHDLEVKVSTLNELRLQQNTSGRNNNNSLLEDIE